MFEHWAASFLGAALSTAASFLAFAFALRAGYFDKSPTLLRLKQVANQALGVAHTLLMSVKPMDAPILQVADSGLSASLTYTSGGKKRIINVPYNGRLRRQLRMYQVVLFEGKGEQIDITQEAGYAYTCSAEQLGGTEIWAKHRKTREIINFGPDTPPMFLGLEPTAIGRTRQPRPAIEAVEDNKEA